MEMDFKIVMALVFGNGVVLAIFYYAFTSKVKEIARTEAKETRHEFEVFEIKIENRLISMDARITENSKNVSLLDRDYSSIKGISETFVKRIEIALTEIHNRIDKVLENQAKK